MKTRSLTKFLLTEAVNLKLRQSSESVKTDLLQIKFDARRYEKLRDLNVSEMSLSEFVELIVYKNLESVSKTINVGEENREKLNERILRLTEMKSKSEVTIENLKKEEGLDLYSRSGLDTRKLLTHGY